MMLVAACCACLCQAGELPPPGPIVQELLSARWLSPQQRSAAARFHGQWAQDDLQTPDDRAEVAHWEWDPTSPDLASDAADELLHARALLRRGEIADSVVVLGQLPASIRRDALLGEALLLIDRPGEAIAHLMAAMEGEVADALEARASLHALGLLHRMQPDGTAATPQALLDALGRARVDFDPAFWPLLLDEARLLWSRGHHREAVNALHEVIELNPRSAEAWFDLGLLHLRVFDFEGVERAMAALVQIRPDHEFALLLDVESALVQQQWDRAAEGLDRLNWSPPRAQALRVATAALDGRRSEASALAARLERERPGDARAHALTGRLLSLHRRHADAERWLRKAIEIESGDHRLWSELGLMWMQAARDEQALTALERAVALDPFDMRAANSLQLLRSMDDWQTALRGDVLLRWAPGIDELFARAIADQIAEVHDAVEMAQEWTPTRPTIVELHPNHEHFAVRVTGLPSIHTFAACTGPLIAMEVPRRGAPGRHAGPFDWRAVLMHELAHVAHLEQSHASVPLWLTEGAAVAGEPVPLDFQARMLLARRWQAGTLLPIEDLTWSFIRPTHKDDRSLAYAQSAWFVMYLKRRFGNRVIPSIMSALAGGATLQQALIERTGSDLRMLWTEFTDQQVPADLEAWGLDRPLPPAAAGADLVELRGLSSADREHAGLLSLLLHSEFDAGASPGDHLEALERLSRMRPLDPWPSLQLADWHATNSDPATAAQWLEQVASSSGADPELHDRLAMLYRTIGRTDASMAAMTRAIEFDPYDVTRRERAAALALEAGRKDLAATHIDALIMLEPGEPLHQRRREALR